MSKIEITPTGSLTTEQKPVTTAMRPVTAPNPTDIDRLATLFNHSHFPEAENLARQITTNFPRNGFAWKVLGAVQQLQGRTLESLDSKQKAAALLPEDAQAHCILGNTLHDLGRLKEAEICYHRALEISPDYAEAHSNLGVTLHDLCKLEEAEASYCRALEIKPGFAETHNNLGNTLKDLGRMIEAETCYLQALELKPDYAEAYNNLGNTLKELWRLNEADTCYRRALQIKPDYAEAHNNLGVTLKNLGRPKEAEVLLYQALRIRPDYAEALNNLGVTLKEMGRLKEAETCHRRALQIKPDYADTLSNLGITLKEQGRLKEAETFHRRALEINPDLAEAHSNLGNTLKDLGQLEIAEKCFRKALEIRPDYAEAYSNLLFTMNSNPEHATAHCFEEARRYGQMIAKKAGKRFSEWLCTSSPDCLRVGLVSGDLCNHPVGYFLETVLAQIDPSRIELIAYPTDNIASELTDRIKPYFSAWKSLVGQNDEAAARLIHSDGVHLLLDLSGHTAKNRLPLFAWKPAPVQASWLGYFATTGVTEMDYLLADPAGVTNAQQSQYTEEIRYLPDTRLCFTAPGVEVPVSDLPALRAGYLTFGCFQNLAKVGDNVLKLWGEILAAVPDSRLRMQCSQLSDPETSKLLRQRLSQQGISPDKVIMQGAVSREAYLAAHAEVDIILDTFPYPGATTTCEALWMGVPTLTLAGDTLLSRQGASLLMAAGLADWITYSEQDYLCKAVGLASNKAALAHLRQNLRNRLLASPLCDAPRFARHLEETLWGMWEQWQISQRVMKQHPL